MYYKSLVLPTLQAKWKEEISTVHWPLEVQELTVDLTAIRSVMQAQAQHIITKGGELWGQNHKRGTCYFLLDGGDFCSAFPHFSG